ncbi:hypothetical protein [Paenibacillus sp. IHBB 10380]|nr:hypothetical protein [Paenibacillus sp. IHBB 10380]
MKIVAIAGSIVGSKTRTARRNRGAFVNEITKAHFGDNLDPDVCRHN